MRPTHDFEALIATAMHQTNATSMLDMGTGGGEFLASLSPLPIITCATEAYLPNFAVAKDRLEPLCGRFLTQQVGGDDNHHLNHALEAPINEEFLDWNVEAASNGLRAAGF